jgi:hypothetical protein
MPITAPVVDPEFVHMDGISRAAEAWRFNILALEHWISPNGQLREWVRTIVRLSLPLSVPILLLVPLITFLMSSLVKWTVMAATIAWKLVLFMVLALVGFFITAFNWMMFKAILGRR